MMKRSLKNFEILIRPVPLVILLGVISGSMLCAFYLGYVAGTSVGYETAQASNVTAMARLPIAAEDLPSNTEEQVGSEVYAKLSDSDLVKSSESAKAMPELDSIKTTKDAPIVDQAINEMLNEEVKKEVKEGKNELLSMKLVEEPELNLAEARETKEKLKIELASNKIAEEKVQLEKAKDKKVEKVASTKEKGNDKSESAASLNESKKSESVNGSLVTKALTKGWYAQVAAPRKYKDAEEMTKKLKASGFQVSIENARVRGEEYFRVMVGPEQNRAQSDELVGQLKRERYIQGEPFVRVVK